MARSNSARHWKPCDTHSFQWENEGEPVQFRAFNGPEDFVIPYGRSSTCLFKTDRGENASKGGEGLAYPKHEGCGQREKITEDPAKE